jgi:hypothetical protein
LFPGIYLAEDILLINGTVDKPCAKQFNRVLGKGRNKSRKETKHTEDK